MLLQWKMAEAKGAWIIVADELIKELKEAGIEMDSKHQGMDNFRKYLEREDEVCKYLFNKLKNALQGIQK